jgi:hypothetical protein
MEETMITRALAAAAGVVLVAASPTALAQEPDWEALGAIPDTEGTGAFPALKEIDPSLPEQVVYRPADLDSLGGVKLGVYAFGNGACSDDGASARLHLLEIASHGYLAIAPGRIYNGPDAQEPPAPAEDPDPVNSSPTRPEQLAQAIDWALAENEREGGPYFRKIDPGAVAVSGFSCGGIQALVNAHDPRVATAVIMNSGVFNEGVTQMAGMEVTKEVLDDLHFATLYVLGGPTDIAYENGMDDVARIGHVPVAVANIDKGHGGTYWEPAGGAAAQVVVDWLDWRLRGDEDAGARFVGDDCGLCGDDVWTYEAKGFD